MKLVEFEQAVEEKAPPHLKGHPFISAAILQVAKEKGPLYSSLIPEVLNRAGNDYEKYILPAPSGGGSIAPTSTEFLAGERLVEKLSPLVWALRENVFGHSEAPFETVADAASWVERESEADLKDWRESSEERDKARKEIERLAREYRIELVNERHTLTYQRPTGDHVKHAPAIPNTRLYKLARETKRIASKTGLPEDAFVMHVLTGLKPMPSRVRTKRTQATISLPNGEQVCSRWVEAKFFAKDLTDKELRKVYGSLRESIGSKGNNGLNGEDRDFWELMWNMEAPPQQDKGKFWKEAMWRWKEIHPDTGINSGDGMRVRYTRLSKRLAGPY